MPTVKIGEIGGGQPRQLYAPEYREVNHRKEDGEITGGRDTQLYRRETFKRAPHTQYPGRKTGNRQYRQVVGTHGDEVSRNEPDSHHRENGARRQAEFEAEQNGENHRNPHERSISRHENIFLHQSGGAHHLAQRREIDTPEH